MAASTGSCPPSELASAASSRSRSGSKPAAGRTAVTVGLAAGQSPRLVRAGTSILAASSRAERRVGKAPRAASDRAPTAAARVKVAGRATGIDARTAVSTSGMISVRGMPRAAAYVVRMTMSIPFTIARLRTTRKTAFCCVLTTCVGEHQFRCLAELRARPGRRDLAHRFAAPHECPCKGRGPRGRLNGQGFAGEHRLVEQEVTIEQPDVGRDHDAERQSHDIPGDQLGGRGCGPGAVSPHGRGERQPRFQVQPRAACSAFPPGKNPRTALKSNRPSNNCRLDVLAENHLQDDRGFEHPGDGCPELAQCHPERAGGCVRHGVGAELCQPTPGLGARQTRCSIGVRSRGCLRARFGGPIDFLPGYGCHLRFPGFQICPCWRS